VIGWKDWAFGTTNVMSRMFIPTVRVVTVCNYLSDMPVPPCCMDFTATVDNIFIIYQSIHCEQESGWFVDQERGYLLLTLSYDSITNLTRV